MSLQIERETNSTFNKLTGSPRKRFYRARAHSNPLKIQFADIGCGFGGQLVALSTQFPDKLMIGMKIRDKVTECVTERISALRTTNPSQYQNISVVRTNSMKYIPNYFEKAERPTDEDKNHCGRVISPHSLDAYAYTLAVGGITCTITDVDELGEWMKGYLENHPIFKALTEEELVNDPVVKLLTRATEEGQKVARNGGQTLNLHWLQSFNKVFIAFKFSCCNFVGACIFHFRSH
ncbi:hypothetical protein ACJRO7_033838 [Eucalyptus globulus]|uniref:tRNA (guanine(46)-N(7))-methyltransferase n=1 Tax=Eucalyptus globulus TaxID=34317 RepID=A0ABD3J1Y3_EUCGL